jgi:hypothetical protein
VAECEVLASKQVITGVDIEMLSSYVEKNWKEIGDKMENKEQKGEHQGKVKVPQLKLEKLNN